MHACIKFLGEVRAQEKELRKRKNAHRTQRNTHTIESIRGIKKRNLFCCVCGENESFPQSGSSTNLIVFSINLYEFGMNPYTLRTRYEICIY